jgi:threonine dehydratase
MPDTRSDGALALPDLNTIRAAHLRIATHVQRTPVLTCRALDAAVGASLYFKCENFQRIGAFKARGAVNAVFSLSDAEAANGVVTHSSGNHGAALAYAAARRGIRAHVVMPEDSARVKIDNVGALGATVHLCAPNVAAREVMCNQVLRDTGATLVHPFDNVDVIAGQGTAAVELLEDADTLDVIITPVGGGGLLSGTAIAARSIRPAIRLYGAEPANADDAQRGFRSGRVEPVAPTRTIADGLRSTVSARTLAAIRANVAGIATASEDAIVRAMRMTWEKMKIVIEPSAAVPLACLLERSIDVDGARVGVILSGGNVDLDRLPWQPTP